jgi:replication factor C subunit 2/4
MESVLTVADGDMRKAVTTLQSVHHFYGKGKGATPEAVREVAGGVPDATIQALWAAIRSGSFDNMQVRGTPA